MRKESLKNPKIQVPEKNIGLTQRSMRLIREAYLLFLIFLSSYVAIILVTYHKQDPSYSNSTGSLAILNKGGWLGARISDIFLYLYGLSAYLWLVLLLVMLFRAYQGLRKHWHDTTEQRLVDHVDWGRWLGFGLLLFGAVGLEAQRLHSLTIDLPYKPGGVLGVTISDVLTGIIGEIGTTFAFLVALMAGFSLFSGWSWLSITEHIGSMIERVFTSIGRLWQDRADRRVGEIAAEVRQKEIAVGKEKRAETRQEPVKIQQPAEVVRSERAQKEKQVPLFQDLPVDSTLPALSLLDPAAESVEQVSSETLEFTSRLIEKRLSDFGVQVTVIAAYPGPVITRYEVEPATGVKGSQIVNLAKDLARSLSLVSIRVVETIPGKNLMGLELPNPKRQIVRLSEIIGSQAYHQQASKLTLVLGKDISGAPLVADLAKMPHVLVAGTTGSGKSVGINAMILSLLYKADASDVRMILIDPKMLEMSVYEGIPHLLAPVVTDMSQAGHALNWCVMEMERRYKLMSKMGVRNLSGFNQKIIEAQKREEFIPNPFSLTPDAPEPLQKLPLIVVVIDELADLMMVVGKKIEELIARLAQKARAAGIHLVLATQRPSVDVITGLIKANIPTRIAFQVSSKIDSRTILDQMGAESLLGQGDMLFLPPGSGLPVRVHGAFVSDDEVHRVVSALKEQYGEPNYIEGILDAQIEGEGASSVTGIGGDAESDPMYDQAVEIVMKNQRASISLVQRHLRIGYNRAARLLEQMENAGLVSSMGNNGNREILIGKRD